MTVPVGVDGVLWQQAVEAAAKALTNEGAAPGSSIHSWRCEYPDRYGECGCVHETARIVLTAAFGVLQQATRAAASPLFAAEEMALTVALAQVERGEQPTPNVTAVCVYALARVARGETPA